MANILRLKQSEVPLAKVLISKKQGGRCALCDEPLALITAQNRCLDHDHKTGVIRGVLCRNCNGIEGKIFNLINRAKRKKTVLQWAKKLIAYWILHSKPQTSRLHPTHRTPDEKRIKRNTQARKKRAAAKG